MRTTLKRYAAMATVMTATSMTFAQQQAQGTDQQCGGDARQALERLLEQRRAEVKQQGDRKVQVEEKAIWGLGELPPDLMTKAALTIGDDADKAKLKVMQAANILQLTASLGGSESQQGQQLKQQAERVRDVAFRIETRQIVNRDQLKQPFAEAALAAASYYQAAAQNGLKQNDEEQTGYTLKGAAAYLAAAHTFAERDPSADVSRATYDANVLAGQIVKNSKRTTVGGEKQGVMMRGTDKGANEKDQQRDVANIPQEAERVVQNLARAIDSVNLGRTAKAE